MIKQLQTIRLPDMVGLIGRLLLVVLIIALCWRIAAWVWVFAIPPSRPVAPSLRAEVDVASISRVPWFGPEPPVEETGPMVTTDLRLVGLFARKTGAAAIIAVGGGAPTAFGIGDEIANGAVLKSVEADHVLLERNGVSERINLVVPVASLGQENLVKDGPKQ